MKRNGHTKQSETPIDVAQSRKSRPQKKYRHVAAVHSIARTSCLSHDSPTTPSFIGFRNLMVIVLSMLRTVSSIVVELIGT
jgi:diacylglycerol O-acyltransferase-1